MLLMNQRATTVLMIYAVAGILLGLLILHPASLYIQHYYAGIRGNFIGVHSNVLFTSFSPQHLPMLIYFAVLGAFIGFFYAIFSFKIKKVFRKAQQLEGLLPICSHCKNIRDDNGNWHKLEAYIDEHSEAEFSHGICADCAEKHYPGIHFSESGS